MEKLNIQNIKQHPLPITQYFKNKVPKNQIVLHHTASGPGVLGDLKWWEATAVKIATAFVVDRNGDIYQCYHSGYWAYHLGVKSPHWPAHDRGSIGIEVDNWGALVCKAGKYYSYTGAEVPAENVQEYAAPGFRGVRYFEKYTPAQIVAICQLVQYLGETYSIPINVDLAAMFPDKLPGAALLMQPGLYTHCSYRKDKTDIHPQPDLLESLRSINT